MKPLFDETNRLTDEGRRLSAEMADIVLSRTPIHAKPVSLRKIVVAILLAGALQGSAILLALYNWKQEVDIDRRQSVRLVDLARWSVETERINTNGWRAARIERVKPDEGYN